MTNATHDDQFAETLRRVIREEVRPIVREEVKSVVCQEVRAVIHEEVRPIIREETQDIRENVQLIKKVQINQSLQLGRMEGDMQASKAELRRLGVLFEDLDTRLQTINESI